MPIYLNVHFPPSFYKQLLDRPVEVEDFQFYDHVHYKNLKCMLDNKLEDIGLEDSLFFTIESEALGTRTSIPLIPNGEKIPVTDENKQQYVERVTHYKMVESVKEQMTHFCRGIYKIIPLDLLRIFNADELEQLICGN